MTFTVYSTFIISTIFIIFTILFFLFFCLFLSPPNHHCHSIIIFTGSALGLLLVFRTNTAYNRFWEGRKIWERILNSLRDLGKYARAYVLDCGVALFLFIMCTCALHCDVSSMLSVYRTYQLFSREVKGGYPSFPIPHLLFLILYPSFLKSHPQPSVLFTGRMTVLYGDVIESTRVERILHLLCAFPLGTPSPLFLCVCLCVSLCVYVSV